MNLSRWALWGGVAAGLSGVAIAVITLHAYVSGGYRGEGASAEQAKECCDKIKRIEMNIAAQNAEAAKWQQVIIDLDKDMKWVHQRLDGHDAGFLEISRTLGRIEGKLDDLRRSSQKGSANPSSLMLGEMNRPFIWRRTPTDSIDDLLKNLEEGGP
jgi:septal ring factor EnvC (AmiA/AmiB activator)